MAEEGGWDRVPAYVQREIDKRGGSINAVASEVGMDTRTIGALLDGRPVKRRDRLVKLATFFGWAPDGFDRIRRGEEPFDPEIEVSASGVDLEELRREDPAMYEQIMELARTALERARRRSGD